MTLLDNPPTLSGEDVLPSFVLDLRRVWGSEYPMEELLALRACLEQQRYDDALAVDKQKNGVHYHEPYYA